MRFTIIVLIISVAFLSSSFSQPQDWQWKLAAKPDIDAGIFGISMLPDGKTGWAVGSDLKKGRIFHTVDGWKTWMEQTDAVVTQAKFSDVDFADEMYGWVVGDSGKILGTQNGGQTWKIQAAGISDSYINQVCVFDKNHAWAATDKGTILYTTDGQNWNLAPISTANSLYGIDFYDATHGIAVGEAETIFYTTDGINWNAATTVPNIGGKDFNAVKMADANTAWLVGDGFSVLGLKSVFAKTIDGGKTWIRWEPTEPIMENMWAIDFTSPTKGVAVGHKGWVFTTTDGNTWTPLQRAFGNQSDAVAIVGDQIWATGSNGTINYSADFGATWSLLPKIVGQNLYKIGAVDDNRIIAIGYVSSVTKTEDGGLNWRSGSVVADNQIALQLWGIDFATANIGWVAGTAGFIAKTIDGGNSWSLQGVNVTAEWLHHIWALNENTVWISGKRGIILKTENGGNDWKIQGAGISTNDLKGIDGLDQNRLAIVGAKSTFLFTTNGGQTWQKATHNLKFETAMNAVDIVDATHAWAVGGAGTILFSADAGATWQNQSSTIAVDLDGVRFKDAMTGWIVGEDGTIFQTSDSGTNWIQIDSTLTNQDLKSVDITPDGKIFACGYNGNIVRYGNPAPSAIEIETSLSIPEQHNLIQNYPNPFNPSTTIDYAVSKACHIHIQIYNLVGQKIATLVNHDQPVGSYQITWNAENIPGGIYFVRMTTNNFSTVRKLLLIK